MSENLPAIEVETAPAPEFAAIWLHGLGALSAYIPSPALLADEFSNANRSTPIFAAHGTEDDIVPLQLGMLARDTLEQYQAAVAWRTYLMPHAVCPEELSDVGAWLTARLNAGGKA